MTDLDTAREEQTALRRVATLVAEGAPAADLFAAVAHEVTRVLDVPSVMIGRYGAGRETTVIASFNEPRFEVGTVWPLDGPSVTAAVLETGRPARMDDYSEVPGTIAAAVRESAIGSTVGAPITVDGTVWGVITIAARVGDVLPEEAEDRLSEFTDLVALAISNAESRDSLRRLADEQGSLRRVATLVAEGATAAALGAAVLEEVVQVLVVPAAWLVRYEPDGRMTVVASVNDPAFAAGSRWTLDGESLSGTLAKTGRPARVDDYRGLEGTIAAHTRDSGFLSAVGVPIVVEGSVWGAICVGTTEPRPLPGDTEARLSEFTELVSIAILNAESRDRSRSLTDEQGALRRVATLVARAAPAEEIFAAVAEEVARLFGLPKIEMVRYGTEGTGTVIGASGEHPFPVGSTWSFDGPSIMRSVYETGRPARIDDYSELPGTIAEVARKAGFESAIGAPIVVDGRTWGSIVAISTMPEPIPEGAEHGLTLFTELVATAVANIQAHDELRNVVNEQSALRRVATLVAEGATAAELFTSVAEEVKEVLGIRRVMLARFEPDRAMTVLAAPDEEEQVFTPGTRWPLDGPSVSAHVFDTARPARIDDYAKLPGAIAAGIRRSAIGSVVGVPIVVDGTVWGVLIVASRWEEVLPPETADRLMSFGELVATALSNADSRAGLEVLANEQAALRRVATIVAEGAPEEVFEAVCAEAGQLLGAASVNLSQYTPDGFNVTIAGWSLRDTHVPTGTRFPIAPDTVGGAILRTLAPVRIDSWEGATSELARLVRERGVRSSVGAPIFVEGKIWGALVAATDREEPLPAGTELRLARFTDLIATAISNAATRSELVASRARIVAAGDEARRRIERNLHDGAQQRLIALGLDVQRVRTMLPEQQQDARSELGRVEADIESVLEEVRELSRGLHPPLLARGGLQRSLAAFARRAPIPVRLEVDLDERPPDSIETAVYYVVSEALTNTFRHAEASSVSVTITSDQTGPYLQVTIADDGRGGADAGAGSGLRNLIDRVDALGGRLILESPPSKGTRISVELPLELPATP